MVATAVAQRSEVVGVDRDLVVARPEQSRERVERLVKQRLGLVCASERVQDRSQRSRIGGDSRVIGTELPRADLDRAASAGSASHVTARRVLAAAPTHRRDVAARTPGCATASLLRDRRSNDSRPRQSAMRGGTAPPPRRSGLRTCRAPRGRLLASDDRQESSSPKERSASDNASRSGSLGIAIATLTAQRRTEGAQRQPRRTRCRELVQPRCRRTATARKRGETTASASLYSAKLDAHVGGYARGRPGRRRRARPHADQPSCSAIADRGHRLLVSAS